MVVALTQADIDRYQALLDVGSLTTFYSELSEKGYQYADLAMGVVLGNSYSGEVALQYMGSVTRKA